MKDRRGLLNPRNLQKKQNLLHIIPLPFLFLSNFFLLKKKYYIIIMSEPLLNQNGTRTSDDQDFGEEISLDNSWVPNEKRPSCVVSFFFM